MKERLQKLISASGLMSRRAAEDAIREGRVLVNGRPALLGEKAEPGIDRITVDGEPLPEKGAPVTLMLYKPRGIVTTLSDEKGRRDVTQLLTGLDVRVFPVGRLDMDSEGLLLMTNDGALANRLMHPSFEICKTYRTWVRGDRLEERAEALRAPLELDGLRLRPAEVTLLKRTEEGGVLDIRIHEGRNRQVRRMCDAVGLSVQRLCRVQEGPLTLGALRPGQWRFLTEKEVRELYGDEG